MEENQRNFYKHQSLASPVVRCISSLTLDFQGWGSEKELEHWGQWGMAALVEGYRTGELHLSLLPEQTWLTYPSYDMGTKTVKYSTGPQPSTHIRTRIEVFWVQTSEPALSLRTMGCSAFPHHRHATYHGHYQAAKVIYQQNWDTFAWETHFFSNVDQKFLLSAILAPRY